MIRRWRAWLSEGAERDLRAAADRAHPKETGGVLVGVLHSNRPWITQAIEIPSGASTGTWFELDGPDRQAAVTSARSSSPDIGYLGEWHVHPADVGPSGTDFETMHKLAGDPEARCPQPVLLLARRRGEGYRIEAHQVSSRGRRRLRLVAAGPLTEERDPRTSKKKRRRD